MDNLSPSRELGKRKRSRLRTALQARMSTLDGDIGVYLADISLTGAKLERPSYCTSFDRVHPGGHAILRWLDFEAFGRVVWKDEDHCGLVFEEMIPPDVLLDTRTMNDEAGGLTAVENESAREWWEGARR